MSDLKPASRPSDAATRAFLATLDDSPALLTRPVIGDLLGRIWPYSVAYLWDALLPSSGDDGATLTARQARARTVLYSMRSWRPDDWDDECERLLRWLGGVGADEVGEAADRLLADPDFRLFVDNEVSGLDTVTRHALAAPEGPLAKQLGATSGERRARVVYAALLLTVASALGGYLGLVAASAAPGSVGDRATVVAILLVLAERFWDEASTRGDPPC